MENDAAVFDAEANLDNQLRQRLAQGSRDGQNSRFGQDAVTIANGGFERKSHANEGTPLLIDGGHENTVEGSDAADDGAPIWPGQAEFDGLPWWKRPSVSQIGLQPKNNVMLTWSTIKGLLFVARFPTLHSGFRRHRGAPVEPHTGAHMSQVLCRQSCERRKLYLFANSFWRRERPVPCAGSTITCNTISAGREPHCWTTLGCYQSKVRGFVRPLWADTSHLRDHTWHASRRGHYNYCSNVS